MLGVIFFNPPRHSFLAVHPIDGKMTLCILKTKPFGLKKLHHAANPWGRKALGAQIMINIFVDFDAVGVTRFFGGDFVFDGARLGVKLKGNAGRMGLFKTIKRSFCVSADSHRTIPR